MNVPCERLTHTSHTSLGRRDRSRAVVHTQVRAGSAGGSRTRSGSTRELLRCQHAIEAQKFPSLRWIRRTRLARVSPKKSESEAEPSAVTPATLGAGALIIVPTYDERENLDELLRKIFEAAPAANLLIVDDASPDGTGQLADEYASRDSRISVLHRSGKLGLGTAYLEGFAWGLARDYAYFLEMDADMSHDPRYLETLFEAVRQGADVVIGSRNIQGGGVAGWGVLRHAISKGGSLYARGVLGLSVRDLTSGYRIYTRRALEAMRLGDVKSTGYAFQVELAYRAVRAGLSVTEVPIVFVDRRAGQSKMSSGIFLEAAAMVLRLRVEALRGKL